MRAALYFSIQLCSFSSIGHSPSNAGGLELNSRSGKFYEQRAGSFIDYLTSLVNTVNTVGFVTAACRLEVARGNKDFQ